VASHSSHRNIFSFLALILASIIEPCEHLGQSIQYYPRLKPITFARNGERERVQMPACEAGFVRALLLPGLVRV
ncbi:hypothetical protein ACFOND_14465, partial [Reinekea marina]